ncbi:MAG: hypothetical protein ABIC04_02965 [Nanoarchaeota archaeon]
MKKVVLSKLWAWIILVLLAFLDSFLDMFLADNSGLQSFFWNPIANLFGMRYAPLMVPFLLLIFFVVAKFGAFLEKKIDKMPHAEELVLTTLVVAYGIFNLWLILVYFFKFSLFRSHIQLIPVIIMAATIYAWWAEKNLKHKYEKTKRR